jgi:hypothetical protein
MHIHIHILIHIHIHRQTGIHYTTLHYTTLHYIPVESSESAKGRVQRVGAVGGSDDDDLAAVRGCSVV